MSRKEATEAIIVIDFGTSSGRCLLISKEGRVLAKASRNWQSEEFISSHSERYCYFDTESAWKSVVSCCKEVAAKINNISIRPVGVITSSQRHGAVLLDRSGKELLGITNMDESTTPNWLNNAKENGPEIYEISGRWPQRVFLPSHLSWLRENNPDLYSRIGKILGIQDWLIYRLCGEIVSEATISTDLLLTDISRKEWSIELVKLFDIDQNWLPVIIPSGTVVGRISREISGAINMPDGLPILNGGADTQLASIGLGNIDPGNLSIIMGSTAPVQIISSQIVLHEEAQTWINPSVLESQWVIESNAGDAGSLLGRFLSGCSFDLSLQANEHENGMAHALEYFDNYVLQHHPALGGVLASVGPGIFHGKKWPVSEGCIRGIQFSQISDPLVFQLYQSIIENIAYAIRGNYEVLTSIPECPVTRVCVGGAMANSPLWHKLLPAIIGVTVAVPEEKEVTSLGAAVIGFLSLGFYPNYTHAVQSMCRNHIFTPDASTSDLYNKKYSEWYAFYNNALKYETVASRE